MHVSHEVYILNTNQEVVIITKHTLTVEIMWCKYLIIRSTRQWGHNLQTALMCCTSQII